MMLHVVLLLTMLFVLPSRASVHQWQLLQVLSQRATNHYLSVAPGAALLMHFLAELDHSHWQRPAKSNFKVAKALARLLQSLDPVATLAVANTAARVPAYLPMCAEGGIKGVVKLLPGNALSTSGTLSSSSPEAWPRFLFLFRGPTSAKSQFPDFRHDEVRGVAATLGIDPQHLKFESAACGEGDGVDNQTHTLQWVSLPSVQAASAVGSRCSLVRSVVNVWATASFPLEPPIASSSQAVACADQRWQLLADVVQGEDAKQVNELMLAELGNGSWRCDVIALGCAKPRSGLETVALIEKFDRLQQKLGGKVKLDTPEHIISLVEDYRGAPGRETSSNDELMHAPSRLFLGWQLATGAETQLKKLAFRDRPYLGRTATPATLALLMANQARVVDGSLVLDPFCGTASTLLACAALGARTVGVEIDDRVLYGGEGGRGIASNFEVAELPLPEKLVNGDARRLDAPDVLPPNDKHYGRFDAIVTDPPYGVMEGIGQLYVPLSLRLLSLLCLAARRLNIGGRLVFLLPIPSKADAYDAMRLEELPPMQRCLKLESISRQIISVKMHRLMVTLRKVAEPLSAEECSEPLSGEMEQSSESVPEESLLSDSAPWEEWYL